MLIIIIGCILIIIAFFLFYASTQIKIKKDTLQEQYKSQLTTKINNLLKDEKSLMQKQLKLKEQFEEDLTKWKEDKENEITLYVKCQRELANQQVQNNQNIAQEAITKINQELEEFQKIALNEKTQTQKELNKIKSSLAAGIQARLREQQKKDKLNFYKLSISNADLSDVKMLENLKPSLHKPVVLSKLIWTQYFQKQMTQLCDRVFGKKAICGIYKITDLLTKQCYIGQSVNIQDRMKQHCKCGLGIEASATNKLYNAMQKDGVWNFTFELLEQCPRELLNEKEKFWIQMYQSNKFGLNTMKGNK